MQFSLFAHGFNKGTCSGFTEYADFHSSGSPTFCDSWDQVAGRYCQGDEMLKNFAAEPHLDKENKVHTDDIPIISTGHFLFLFKSQVWNNGSQTQETGITIQENVYA